VPVNVHFDLNLYESFCQKMIGINAASHAKGEAIQKAIINLAKRAEKVKVTTMNKKKAQILKKDEYMDGVPVNRGELVYLKWSVKNLTSNSWSDDVVIVCAESSDLRINEQKADLKLSSGEKGTMGIKFIMPKDTDGRKNLDLHLYLFDRETNTAIGEDFKVTLRIYK
jgi:hypothetical protein